jgi:dipeptidyl aminopeptidase/acylaminoacyl peptidase
MITRDMVVRSGGVTIRGTVLLPRPAPSPGGAWPVALLCHGIPSGVAVEGDPGYEALARRFVGSGTAACYFNFRGTGVSDGNFSLPGWAQDLDAVLDEISGREGPFEDCDRGRVALMGFSGGGAVCIICASGRDGLRGVASLSSPADFTRMMPRQGMGSFITHAREIGIIRDTGFPPSEEDYYREMTDFIPMEKVAGLSPTPLLIVHGDQDDLVPVEEARRLYSAAREPKELFIVPGGGHKLRLNAEAMDKAVTWVLKSLR